MTAGRRLSALVLALAVLVTTGCVQVPQRVTATADPRPSMSDATATKLVKRYIAIDDSAWKKLDPSALSKIITGPELENESQWMIMEKRTEGKQRSTELPKDARYTVSSTPGGHYPALAVISGTHKGRKKPDSFYLAQRASAADPWLISYSTDESLNTFLPDVAEGDDHTFKPVSAKTKINGVTADTVSDLLTDALLLPKSKAAKRFVANEPFNSAKSVPLEKDDGAHMKKRYDYINAPWRQAYRTAKGDLIVFGAFTESIRYDGTDNYYRYFKSGEQKKLLPGKYSSITYTQFWRYSVRVPTKGKFAIQQVARSLDNLTGEPYTSY